ncbi:MAG TPA: amino acid racemase [Thermoanaerobaculia bacterium]
MRALGIVGGIGPESTIVYYRTILDLYRRERPGAGDPRLVITHFDVDRLLARVAANELDELAAELTVEIARLARAGADFALLAANTPHVVFDEVQRRSPIPLLSIVECVRDEASRRGFRRLGLLGTRFAMDGRFYAGPLAGAGIATVPPAAADQELVHRLYVTELVPGIVRDASRQNLLAVVSRLHRELGADAVVLAGTELSLILDESVPAEVPLLDSTRIHAAAAVRRLLA